MLLMAMLAPRFGARSVANHLRVAAIPDANQNATILPAFA